MQAKLRKLLIGRTIVDVKTNPFDNGKGGKAHDPRIVLDNGRELAFCTEETEVGEYGIEIQILNPRKGKQ